MISYLKVLTNGNDMIALMRVINYPVRGVGKATQVSVVWFSVMWCGVVIVIDIVTHHHHYTIDCVCWDD